MSKNFDIKLKVVSSVQRKGTKSSSLKVEFTGKDVYPKLINTISRVASNGVPTYAFPPQLINIEQNTCVAYDNQYMQLRFSNLPLYNVSNDLHYLHDKFWKHTNYADTHRETHPSEKDIKMYLNVHNNSNEIQYITTNDAKIYVDGEETKMYDKDTPILLIKLRPNDSFKCNMTAALGVGELNAIWRASVNSYAPYENDVYSLSLHSNGQESEKVLLEKSVKHILKRLEDIKKQIEKMVNEREIKNDEELTLILDGEDHTMGEVLNYEFQSHDNLCSGVCKPDLLIKSISFKLDAVKSGKMIKSIMESIDTLHDKYSYILSLVSKMK